MKIATCFVISLMLSWSMRCVAEAQGSNINASTHGTTINANAGEQRTDVLPPAAPTLVSPANGATDQPLTPTLTWNPVRDATLYHVYVSTDSTVNVESPFTLQFTTDGTSIVTSALYYDTRYYWRVRADSMGFYGPYSATWSFTTAGPPPPALVLPVDGATNQDTSLTLVWREGTTYYYYAYTVEVATDPSFDPKTIEVQAFVYDTTLFVPNLADGTTYYWHVRGIQEGASSAFSAAWRFTTRPLRPLAPQLISPSDGATGQPTTVVLVWNPEPTATSYHVQVAGDPNFATGLVLDNPSVSGTTITTFPLSYGSLYYWRVSATNASGAGPYSVPWSFTTAIAAPIEPVLVFPADGASNQPSTLTLRWTSSPTATSYRVQVATVSDFLSGIVFDYSSVRDTFKLVTGLSSNTVYYWRVNAANDGGPSRYSSTWRFTTRAGALFSVAPTGLTFGNVVVSTSRKDSVTVRNTGFDQLVISSVSSNNPDYIVVPQGGTIAATDSERFYVTFTPHASGPSTARLLFVHSASTSPDSVGVSGAGIISSFSVDRSAISFGGVTLGTSRRDSITVLNVSTLPINVSATMSGDNAFSVSPAGAVINPSSGQKFLVTFRPVSIGLKAGNLVFASSAGGPPDTVTVNGTGIASPFSIDRSSVSFGDVPLGTSRQDSVMVSNPGTVPVEVSATMVGDNAFSVSPPGSTIMPALSQKFLVTFRPSSTGLKAGNLLFTTGPGGPQDTVTVTGVGIVSAFSIDRSAISFGSVPLGASRQDSATVTNLGTVPADVSATILGDNEFGVTPAGASINPSQSQKFSVTFHPASVGSKAGLLVFRSSAGGEPDTVALSGVGFNPGFTVSPDRIAFGRVRVGTSKLDSLVVTNLGLSTLNMVSTFSSDARFRIAPTNAVIGPSSSLSFRITFTPSAPDTVNGFVVLTPEAPNSPDTVTVGGRGVAAALAFSPRALVFDSVAVTSTVLRDLVLKNSGSASLTIDSLRVQGTDQDAFSVVNPVGEFPVLQPAESLLVVVQFRPLTSGSKIASLAIYSNAPGSPAGVSLSGFARPLLIQVGLTGDTTAGKNLGVFVTSGEGYVPNSATLFFRNGGKRNYDSISLAGSAGGFTGLFPSSVVNERGIEYYLRLSDGKRILTDPPINPAGNPRAARVKILELKSPLTLLPRLYRMVSVPLDLNDPSLASVFFGSYGSYNTSLWRLFRWEGGTNMEFPDIAARATPGMAFWLATSAGVPYKVGQGRSMPTSGPSTIGLVKGWNQIASPFAFPVAWDSVNGSDLVKGLVYFDGVQYQTGVKLLQPWEGYFVFDPTGGAVLGVPPVEASTGLERTGGGVTIRGGQDFVVQLSAAAEGTGLRDSYRYLGFMQDAREGDDRYDIPEPPMMGDHIRMSIMERGQGFMCNFKPLPAEGEIWGLNISSTRSELQVQVTLNETGQLPDGYALHILDLDYMCDVPVQSGRFNILMGKAGAIRSLELILGTKDYAERRSGGIPLVPLADALEQNYPNPFNPETVIRYQLSKRADVLLEVYDIVGQRIRTLVSSEQFTGSHTVVWDGMNDLGCPAASGVYIYRLEAGNYVAARKLLLLR